jgi:predicted DNA-binding transcriptional regulator AlpA
MNAPLPHWPRLLSDDLAAAYVGLSVTTFRERVGLGKLPKPVRIGKRTLWDRRMLDRQVDALSGLLQHSRPGEGWED